MVFSEGNQFFAGDFHAVLDKKMLICFNLIRNSTGNGFSDTKDTFAESFKLKLQMSVLHQSMCMFKVGLSSLRDSSLSSAKYKERVPDVSDSTQNIKTTCNARLKFTELKDLFIKRE